MKLFLVFCFVAFVWSQADCTGKKDTWKTPEQCVKWAKLDYCNKGHKKFMDKNCVKTCCEASKQMQVVEGGGASGCGNYTDSAQYKSSCSRWAKSKFCSLEKHAMFMKSNCANTCCTAANTGDQDQDRNEGCQAWAASPRNFCEKNDFVKKNCKKSCKKGDQVVEDTDKDKRCQGWVASKKSFCQNNNFVKNNCKKSCKNTGSVADQEIAEEDKDKSCQEWVNSGKNYCQTNDHVKKTCRKSCRKLESAKKKRGQERNSRN